MLTSMADNTTIPVGFKPGIDGDYTIKVSDLISFSVPDNIYLKDMFTNIITDLNQHSTYTFSSFVYDNANRFQLLLSTEALGISDSKIQNISIYANDKLIYINTNETIQQISIYNSLGQLLKTSENMKGNTKINMKAFASAYYFVRVITAKNVFCEKVLIP